MKLVQFALCSTAILIAPAARAEAQAMNMPGMTMHMPATTQAQKKPAARKAAPEKPKAMARPAPANPASPPANDLPSNMKGMTMGSAGPGSQMTMPMSGHAGEMAMSGVLGPYPMTRESSGTAWQPDASEHMGLMSMSGGWTLMAHGTVNFVYDHQSGPRGDDQAFASGMLMGMARRPLGNGTLQLRASISPDPIMGPRGYPLLLATGETADGISPLVDRQHPHDLFMELSASIAQNIGRNGSLFVYAGLPGEPAFGPPAFMHREAIMDSPEAPISHHWLDSTHISFGVVTGGLVLGRTKIEVSRFNAREPDQHRWNIETGPLDSTAVRLSWNPTSELALQGSWGRFKSPEQLEPGVDQTRWSASLLYAREVAAGWELAGTLAWGRKRQEGRSDDAYVAEASVRHGSWTVFGRGELVENRELLGLEGPAFRVGKVSLGAVRDFRLTKGLSLGAGGQVAVNVVPDALAPFYGSRNPTGAMAFVRLKLD